MLWPRCRPIEPPVVAAWVAHKLRYASGIKQCNKELFSLAYGTALILLAM
jgi:hypothetical protein